MRMYIDFKFWDGSNPYIAITPKSLFFMVWRYYLVQTGEKSFYVSGLREWNGKPRKDYKICQDILRAFAIEWQHDFSNFDYSYDDLAMWGAFFEEYGHRFGLLREFLENGII